MIRALLSCIPHREPDTKAKVLAPDLPNDAEPLSSIAGYRFAARCPRTSHAGCGAGKHSPRSWGEDVCFALAGP
jgi:hypothetical protein